MVEGFGLGRTNYTTKSTSCKVFSTVELDFGLGKCFIEGCHFDRETIGCKGRIGSYSLISGCCGFLIVTICSFVIPLNWW